jgi:hypothetical protein
MKAGGVKKKHYLRKKIAIRSRKTYAEKSTS